MKYKVGDTVYHNPHRTSKYYIRSEIVSINEADRVIRLQHEDNYGGFVNFVIGNFWGSELFTTAEYMELTLDKELLWMNTPV